MEAGARFFPRWFALSALLHASLATIGMTVVRLGASDTVTPLAVEVSLVESVVEAAAAEEPPADTKEAPAATTQPPAPAAEQLATTKQPPVATEEPLVATEEPLAATRQPPAPVEEPMADTGATLAAIRESEGIVPIAPSSSLAPEGGDGTGVGGERVDGVRAWLERHKRYPRAAAQRRIEGEAILGLVLDSSGAVVSSRILTSSGHAVLDDEVLRMVTRAAPFPADAQPSAGTGHYRIVIEFYLEEE